MTRTKSIRSATQMMAGTQLATSVCRFLRNVVLARILMPADFGVGATFALTLSFLELISDFGPGRQIVQSKEGATNAWQANTQMFIAVRGMFLAAILFALAPFIASYFDVPNATSNFRWLAAVPLIRGMVHCDIFRYQRDLNLGRLAIFQSAPTILGFVVAPFFALYFRDYRAFLAIIVFEATVGTGVSHAFATRRYRWGFDRSIFSQFASFGLPLLGNGLLLFAIMHGDRFLIASYFSLDLLGAFSVAFGLAFAPMLALSNIHGAIALPLFARSREDAALLDTYGAQSSQLMCLAGGLLATTFVTAGPWLIGTIYGQRYLLASNAIAWIGLMCAIRIARTTPTKVAVAHGATKIPFVSNFARAASFGVAWWLASHGFDFVTIPICGFAGEVAAYIISLALLHWQCGLRTRVYYGPVLAVASFVASVWIVSNYGVSIPGVTPPWIAALWLVSFVTYCAIVWPSLRSMAFQFIRAH